jgi:starvation-inducible outer membrane lipoprotein
MRILLVALCLILSSCVTINIYFPEAAAEKAADKIIDEVWQIKPEEGAQPQK